MLLNMMMMIMMMLTVSHTQELTRFTIALLQDLADLELVVSPPAGQRGP